ncbi:AfsR/SARP family transcriptional regulator [Saccharothrix australiensis]|uniref:DNA-binding SARP family transcriptional activator n=1 Tax=Saccharothrix australiensis TaxID=2072 RepID=A0A495W0J9_9PSEU|nr:AfsR/SARP family transcriptional regulator [Saccharothrix australiensis]RKT54537.1 DNA-binding SARP family transcriptional activator [Saccharothrix australiensis]
MRFRVLGPLELTDGSVQVGVHGTKQRAALAYLLFNANRVVSTSELLDILWPTGETPNSARKILHNAIWGLRGVLNPEVLADDRVSLLTRPPGYVLELEPSLVDLHRFHRLAAEGRAQLAAGRPDRAGETLGAALGLWRGAVLADLVEAGFGWPELAAVESARVDALEDYFDAELARGRHHAVLHDIETTVEQESLRERLCGQLMLALYRCGRQTDALEAYNRMRARLVDDLGLEPGVALQELQRAILRHDDSLRLGPREPVVAGRVPAAVGALALNPAPVVPFVGDRRPQPGPVWTPHRAVHALPPAALPPAAEAVVPESVVLESAAFESAAFESTGFETAGLETAGFESAVPVPRSAERGHPAPRREELSVLMAQVSATGDGEQDPVRLNRALAAFRTAFQQAVDLLGGRTDTAPGAPIAWFHGRAELAAAERAVSAALAVLAPAHDAISVRAAVATGEAVVFRLPGAAEDRLVITGPVVDTCQALLARTAAGSARACDTTRALTGHSADYGPRTPGGGGSRIRSAHWHSVAHPSIPIVDRDWELDVLTGLIDRSWHRGVPQLVTVLGGPGVGKSRLVLEFERRAIAKWDTTEFLVAGPGSASSPFGPLPDLLLALCGGDQAAPRAEALRGLVAAHVADPAEAERVAAALADVVAPEPNPRDAAPGQASVAAALAAGATLLRAVAADRPLVVFVDDAHELDDRALDFLTGLVAEPGHPALALVLAARPELLQRRPDWGAGLPHAATITLTPLSESAIDRLSDMVVAGMRRRRIAMPPCRIRDSLTDQEHLARRRAAMRVLMLVDGLPSPAGHAPADQPPTAVPPRRRCDDDTEVRVA